MLHFAMNFSRNYLVQHLPTITDSTLRDDILAHGKLATFAEGDTIITRQQYIDYVPLFTAGGAKVVRQTAEYEGLLLYFLETGDTCAMTLSSCLRREQSQITAVTVAPTELILLPVARVYYYTRHWVSWNEFMLQAFRGKFDILLDAFEQLASADMAERVMEYLKTVVRIRRSDVIPITHQELASNMGVSRVGLSRILKQLEKERRIELKRGRIIFTPQDQKA